MVDYPNCFPERFLTGFTDVSGSLSSEQAPMLTWNPFTLEKGVAPGWISLL